MTLIAVMSYHTLKESPYERESANKTYCIFCVFSTGSHRKLIVLSAVICMTVVGHDQKLISVALMTRLVIAFEL